MEQMGRPGGRGPDRGSEMDELLQRANERAFFYTDASFIALRENLKSPDFEAAKENWKALMETQLAQTEELLDGQLLRFKNPYPYESRQQDMWFTSQKDGIRRARNEAWSKKNPEAKAWLDRTNSDLAWGDANFRVLEGMGGVIDKFFDGKQMLSGWVRERFRSDPIATYYEIAFAKKVPGLITDELGPNNEIVPGSLRERAVDFQDESIFWRMAVATVHQTDLTGLTASLKPVSDPEALPLVKNLTEKEAELIRELFAKRDSDGTKKVVRDKNGKEYPMETLNWYAMSSSEDYKRRYIAIMEALLVLDIKNRLNNPSYQISRDKAGNVVFSDEFQKLIGEINSYTQERLKNWFSPEKTLDQKLAGVVIKSGIVFDLCHFSVSQMAWGWDYKEAKVGDTDASPEEIKLGVKRDRAEGPTTTATDIPNMAKWFNFHSGTDVKAWTVGMVPPLEENYRKEINRTPMGWVPKLYEVVGGRFTLTVNDPKLEKLLENFWKDSSWFKWDPALKEWLQTHAWYITTPLKDPATGENIVFPMFFPPEFDSINFWNTISLVEGGGKPQAKIENGSVTAGKPSVWDELRDRHNFSDLKWTTMGDQSLYRWLITISQTAKYLITLLEPEGGANRDQFEDFFGSPARVKELLKRVDLGERDEKAPTPILTISLVPMLIILRAAQKHGIMGTAGDYKERRSLWAAEVAKWIAMFRNLPKEREGAAAYGQHLAKLTQFYAVVVARTGKVAGMVEKLDADNIYKQALSPEMAQVGAGIEDQVVSTKPPVESITRG